MAILKFRMLSDENDNFVREYEVASQTTLLELHNFLLDSLEYEPCIASFYTADEQWERTAEFTAEDMGFDMADQQMEGAIPTMPMEEVVLSQILTHVNDRLIYLFDIFGNRAYFLELVAVTALDATATYPREIFAHATPADQYDPSSNIEDGSIFEEMMGDFDDSEGYDDYNDEW